MKKFLSLVLALVMTMSLVTISAGAEDFKDADNITYVEAVEVLTTIGVVEGGTDGNFNPTNGLTRGAAAKIICNLILGPTTASALNADTNPYPDVNKDSVFAGYIAYCAKEGIISGYADGTFKPANPLTGYAFMKMLLGALGYDPAVEGYTGANWSINVAKRALNIGLDNGLVEEFNGSDYVTREEAMLYALNTLESTMVEYDAKTSVSVGGADVVIAGSNAKEVAQGIYKNNMDKAGLQFAEKYFSKLNPTYGTTDAFMRPATTWHFRNDEVGTYSDAPDASYSTNTKAETIYNDLGLTEQIDAAYFRNGVAATAIHKDGTLYAGKEVGQLFVGRGVGDKTNTGNGTLVEVFYNRDAGTVRVVAIDTYVGEIGSVNEATATKDAYVTVVSHVAGQTLADDEFETDVAFEVEEVVLFTYSEKAGVNEIISIETAESVEGELTKIYDVAKDEDNSKVTVGGVEYKISDNPGTGCDKLSMLNTKSEYIAYLDNYGYVIEMAETEFAVGDYAFVMATKTGVSTFSGAQAKLAYLDGTTAVVDTKYDYNTVNVNNKEGDYASQYYLVTHNTNDKGQVALKIAPNQGRDLTASTDIYNGVAGFTANGNTYYTNSDTIVVVWTYDNNKVATYTGTKNMPNALNADVVYATRGTSSMVKYMLVMADSDYVWGGSNAVTFLAGASMSDRVTETDVIAYYEFNAVVDGEITTVKVDVDEIDQKVNHVFDSAYVDEDGVLSNLSILGTGTIRGIEKLSGDYTMGFDYNTSTKTYNTYAVVAKDVEVYKVSATGEITKSSVGAIGTNPKQDVTYVTDWMTGEVTHIFLNAYDSTEKGEALDSYVNDVYQVRYDTSAKELVVELDTAVPAGKTEVVSVEVSALSGSSLVAIQDVKVVVAAGNTIGKTYIGQLPTGVVVVADLADGTRYFL